MAATSIAGTGAETPFAAMAGLTPFETGTITTVPVMVSAYATPPNATVNQNKPGLTGHGGDDILYGAFGMDGLHGGTGPDRLYGGPGDDGLDGQAGPNKIRGGGGNDVMSGWWASEPGTPGPNDRDLLSGGPGNDFFDVSEGPDRVVGGRDDDDICTEDDDAVDVIRCGPGRDVVTYYGPVDPLDVRTGCERVRVAD